MDQPILWETENPGPMRSLLLTLAMLTTFSLPAQIGESAWSYVGYERFGDYQHLETGPDGQLVVLGEKGLCGLQGYLRKFEPDGHIGWRRKLTSPRDLYVAPDTSIWVVGLTTLGTPGPDQVLRDGIYWRHYSSSGDTLSSGIYPYDPRDADEDLQITPVTDSLFAISYPDKVLLINQLGAVSNSLIQTGITPLQAVSRSYSTVGLLSTGSFHEVNFHGEINSTWSSDQALVGMFRQESTLWIYSADTLFQFESEDDIPSHRYPFPNGFEPIDISTVEDAQKLLLIGNRSGDFTVFSFENGQFTDIEDPPVIGTVPKTVRFADGRIIISGAHRLEEESNFLIMKNGFLSSAPLEAPHTQDITHDLSIQYINSSFTQPMDTLEVMRNPETGELIVNV